MFSFALVTTDNEALGVFAYGKRDWKPGDIIPQGSASLRALDVIPADPLDEIKVGLLRVEPAGL
jgi:hypothetical protein